MLGCGVQVKSKANKDLASFDLNQLRWSKVILCTDADVDGFQIRTLLLTMIYRLTPALIEAGKVFIAESPLYEITSKTDTYLPIRKRKSKNFWISWRLREAGSPFSAPRDWVRMSRI